MTKHSTSRFLAAAIVIAAAIAPTIAMAQDWSNVTSLPGGTSVEVIHGRLQRLQGVIASTTADAISVRTRIGESVIPRTEVRRVSVASTSRKKRALIGAVIGAAAVGASADIWGHAGDIDIRRDLVVGAGAIVGTAAGAGVGAATGGPRTIYRAP